METPRSTAAPGREGYENLRASSHQRFHQAPSKRCSNMLHADIAPRKINTFQVALNQEGLGVG